MAIGDYGNNNSSNNANQKSSDTTYYSRLRFRSKDNKRSLTITFWSGLMILDINDVDVNNGFKPNSLETIRLSQNKAKILFNELKSFKEYMKSDKIDPNKAFGVTSGLGNEVPYIGFSCQNDENKTVGVTIGKINNSGDILSAQTMMFDNSEFNFGLEWNNISKMDVERVYHPNMELDMIMDALYDFSTHMNGALAYSVLNLGRYDMNRIILESAIIRAMRELFEEE